MSPEDKQIFFSLNKVILRLIRGNQKTTLHKRLDIRLNNRKTRQSDHWWERRSSGPSMARLDFTHHYVCHEQRSNSLLVYRGRVED